ncbi:MULTISPECIES: TetR/AcrR family transcriptional regulator [unclassified Fusibacter]|uniref:TetR/AcrR family transcriptional regulator n=1 Tax=unclassified Fusibacter TaxID=2624464 RepID=UPI0013E93D12|nr:MULTISPECIES: helix-turn-helix domain-containing protein [unclassified Fusibacter]MCK8060007.1 TetR/AcrR family transcriptional regulator [Fusibacter sp. A2]NPE22147.1 helix-turn-helix transcriptional regulator [Fusibacter sp. A1]
MAQVLKDEIRLNILDAAREVFVVEGFESSSMRQIAKGAGVTVGNLYRYFDNKEAMYDAIISDVISAINGVLLEGSAGKVGFHTELDGSATTEEQRMTAKRILEGLNRLVPTLLDKHMTDLMILLQSADKLRHHPHVFDLISWVGRSLELGLKLNGSGEYAAIALIKGVEAILADHEDIDTTSSRLQVFMSYMTMRE